jgi:hypothetical protein
MTTANRWGWRALWALAACIWLAVLPAMAMNTAAMARAEVHDLDVTAGHWQTHLKALALPLAGFVGGGRERQEDWKSRRILVCVVWAHRSTSVMI